VDRRIGKGLRERGINLKNTTVAEVIDRFEHLSSEEIEAVTDSFTLAGRVMSIHDFGKVSFIHLRDGTGKLQAYIRKDRVGEKGFEIFKLVGIGDHIGITGRLFRTGTGELTLLAGNFLLLSKYVYCI